MSTHFGRSLDVQGGEGGQIYEDAKAVFAAFGGKGSVIIRILQFILSKSLFSILYKCQTST